MNIKNYFTILWHVKCILYNYELHLYYLIFFQGQRIRARRQEKSRLLTESVKQSQGDSEYSKVTEYKEQTGTQSNQVQATRKRKHGELSPFIKEGGKPSGQVISSLFRFNPEIPKVKRFDIWLFLGIIIIMQLTYMEHGLQFLVRYTM